MGNIYNKYIEYYNGKPFNLPPDPFQARYTYSQLGEIRTRTSEAILSLENKIENGVIPPPDLSVFYTKAEMDYKLQRILEMAEIDLSDYALASSLARKVDKVDGKGLSTSDYTPSEKAKLATLENYTHPVTHLASMVVFTDGQNLQHKFNAGDLGSGSSGGGGGTGSGEKGEAGTSILTGNGVPSNALGNVGDVYINNYTSLYYKKMGVSNWTQEGNLKGATGATGANGSDGRSVEYQWNGTILMMRQSGGEWDSGVNLRGQQGIKGETGDKGETGASLNLNIGTVSVGTSATDYALSLSGVFPDLYLNMKMPKAEKGDAGSAGEGLLYNWSGTSLGVKRVSDIDYTYTDLKGVKGDAGATGAKGIGLMYNWVGTSLGVKTEADSSYSYVDLKGETGSNGKSLEHQWVGTYLQVRTVDGAWGTAVNLKGEKGDNGTNGVPNQLLIGTVTTSASGSSASATITGTSPNQLLNLTLPRGEKGEKGDSGVVTNQNGGGELKFWSGTQAQYDAIETKDSNTIYFVN